MRQKHTLRVMPHLPEPIERLRAIALDLHWTWNHDAIDLFSRLDPFHWKEVGHNPIRQIAELPQERLEEVASDEAFLALLDQVEETFKNYRKSDSWFQEHYPQDADLRVAYLSMEFGLHESLPMYSGGLGVLAGDHLKAASDLGVPLIGIGLFYRRGYFRQYLNADGWQQEAYPIHETYNLPLKQVKDENRDPVQFTMQVGGRDVNVQIWRVQVGRLPLFLLDTSSPDNHPDDRRITETLYGGDSEMRIRQEIILGVGGMKALVAMGIQCNVFHMNEGHAAFLALERIRRRMDQFQMTFAEAREAVRASHVFTTHTPVPAGIDRFSQELIGKYFQNYWPQLGLDRHRFMGLGGANADDTSTPFNMATMAINLSAYTNGVSKLHGDVSRRMWQQLWPSLNVDEVPINSVTNGVHTASWLSAEMLHVLDRYLGPGWMENGQDGQIWERIERISNEELWRAKERARQRLVTFARERLSVQLAKRGESRHTVELASDVLDMEALTIGFARRFATYKRANLLFRDPERLFKLLTDPERPVQIILAGKAHPKDEGGKNIIREIIHFSRHEQVRDRIVFLENYDIDVARHMVQGTDIWLNNPRVPMEASGTSGMKAVMNGSIHVSTLDGWWAEAYQHEIGWTIGHGEEYENTAEGDQIEAELLYDLLEKEIIPLFYDRKQGRVPRGWAEMIKRSLIVNTPFFNTNRMVRDYAEQGYLPNYRHYTALSGDNYKHARELAAWKERVYRAWHDIKIADVNVDTRRKLTTGDEVPVEADVFLGQLNSDDVTVEVYYGRDTGDALADGRSIAMTAGKANADGSMRYTGSITCDNPGAFGFSLRVLPSHPQLRTAHDMRVVTWEQ